MHPDCDGRVDRSPAKYFVQVGTLRYSAATKGHSSRCAKHGRRKHTPWDSKFGNNAYSGT